MGCGIRCGVVKTRKRSACSERWHWRADFAVPISRDDGRGLNAVAEKPDAHIPSRRTQSGAQPDEPLLDVDRSENPAAFDIKGQGPLPFRVVDRMPRDDGQEL